MKTFGIFSVFFILLSVCVHKGWSTCSTTTTLTATSSYSTVNSHFWYGSSHYSNNDATCWRIQTSDSSKIIELYSVAFQLEYGSSSCPYDVLKVYDSSSASGSNVEFCGSSGFTSLYSSGQYMYLDFSTDSSNTYNGFQLGYRQVDSSNYDSSRWSGSYYSYSVSSTLAISIGAIVGIVFAVIVGIVIVVIVIIVCVAGQAGHRGRVGARRTNAAVVVSQQQQQVAPAYGAQPQPPYGAQPQPQYGAQPPPTYGNAVQPPSYTGNYPPPPASQPTSNYPPPGGSSYPPPPANNPVYPPPPPAKY